MILSAMLALGGISGYISPVDPIFVASASVVLFVEAVFIWHLSTRGGRKAMI
jgi:hypothetical protein